MSKPRPLPDAERTALMVDLVRQRYARQDRMALSHVVLEQVAPGTGWTAAARWADLLVLGVWPSRGMLLEGYEVKASKQDLRRELGHLEKHRALARYCNRWWLLVWEEALLLEGIPEDWGIMATEPDGEDRVLKVLRQAPERKPEPWPRHFMCSLVRNAYEQAPGAHYLARACLAAAERSREDTERMKRGQMHDLLRPLQEALYGHDRQWEWPHLEPEELVQQVVARMTDLFGSARPERQRA